MNIASFLPKAELNPYIQSYLIIESTDGQVNSVLPNTSLVMAFRYKGQISLLGNENDTKKNLSPAVISGLRKSQQLISYSHNTANILVIFKEAGIHPFIKDPLHELFNDSIDLDSLSGYNNLPVIEEQLAAAGNNQQRVALIEKFLLAHLSASKADALILAALEKIRLAKGILRIKDLAHELCISQDAFEKRFRRFVGTSPKHFAHIIRMRSMLQAGLDKQRLVELALETGYFDQSHFNKSFKQFTGQTPTDFLRTPTFW